MNSIDFPELQALKTSIDPSVADRHLAEVSTALRASEPVRPPMRRALWRRWAASVAVAASALVPAAAVASDNAVPGDTLYGLKLRLEPLVRLVDSDVVARHRVEELEAIEVIGADQATVDDLIADARAALSDVESPELAERLNDVITRRTMPESERPGAAGATDDPRPADSARTTTTTVVRDPDPAATPPTTADPGRDRDADNPPPTQGSTTTTAPNRDGDGHGDGQADRDGSGGQEPTTTTTIAGDASASDGPDRASDRP